MNAAERERFWRLYGGGAQRAIDRACRSASRVRTGNTLPAEDLIAWAEDRLMRMLEEGGWPVFHDGADAQEAAARVEQNAGLFARWAYMALSRRHWRRRAAEEEAGARAQMTRAASLAATSRTAEMERSEAIDTDLAAIRSAIDARTRARMAAAWHDPAQARRVAVVLEATDEKADELLESAARGEIKQNTLDQMRSRSRAAIREVLGKRVSYIAPFIVAIVACFGLTASARGDGEQTGGGRNGAMAQDVSAGCLGLPDDGEQTGGGRNG